MKPKVIQQVEDAMVDACMDAASGLGLSPLQRAKFIVAISETLIDAITPYVQHESAVDEAPAPKRSHRAVNPDAPKRKRRTKAEIAAAAQSTLPLPPPPAPPVNDKLVTPDVSQPAPFRAAPVGAQPFGG